MISNWRFIIKKNQAKFAPQFQFLAEYNEEAEKYQALDDLSVLAAEIEEDNKFVHD